MALTLLGLLTSLLALVPAAPAQAAVRPILLVGGFTQVAEISERTWADPLAEQLKLTADQVRVVELAGLIPGSASMDESALRIRWAIDELYGDYGKIDIIAVSQGSPAARRALQLYPSTQTKVAGFISLSGANLGIPLNHPDPTWAQMLTACTSRPIVWAVCSQMVYPAGQPGNTAWLMDVNGVYPAGDPTPGDGPPNNIAYYYIYSERTTTIPPEDEGLTAYGWTSPLRDATPMSAQDACPWNPNRIAPHAAWYPVDADQSGLNDPDMVMRELVIDALNRQPLAIADPATCADHPFYPSG